jgi:RNA polymerase sigma factor (sigma-70 family)
MGADPVPDDDEVPEDDENTPDDPLATLVRAAARGDAHAWEQLVDRFHDLVWSICRAYRLTNEDAADVVQLTWLHLLESLDRIRDPQRLAGWLATTCRRECQAAVRRLRSSVSFEDDHLDRLAGGVSAADEPFLAAAEHAALWQAFQLLSEWCQRVLRELVINPEDGPPSYRLVADKLQVPVGSLGPTRGRCLRELRKLLDRGGI